MSLLKSYGDSSKDPGQKFEVGPDVDHPEITVYLIIRRYPETKRSALIAKHGGDEEKVMLTIEGRSAYIKQRVLGMDEMSKISLEQAVFCLVDSENLSVTPQDDVEADFWRAKLADPDLAAGSEICLDGKWTDTIRRHVLLANPDLADWIVGKARELGESVINKEKRLTKN